MNYISILLLLSLQIIWQNYNVQSDIFELRAFFYKSPKQTGNQFAIKKEIKLFYSYLESYFRDFLISENTNMETQWKMFQIKFLLASYRKIVFLCSVKIEKKNRFSFAQPMFFVFVSQVREICQSWILGWKMDLDQS